MTAALVCAGWFALSLVAAGVIGRGIALGEKRRPRPERREPLRLIQGGAK